MQLILREKQFSDNDFALYGLKHQHLLCM